jgi:hypothetical protein
VIGTATVRQELPMSPIVPALPPYLVQLGFDYILAVETGDDVQAARLAPEVEQLSGIAELIVFPVTALSDDTDPSADSFVLDEVGVICLMAIRAWATHAPAAAAPGGQPTRRPARHSRRSSHPQRPPGLGVTRPVSHQLPLPARVLHRHRTDPLREPFIVGSGSSPQAAGSA